MPNLMSRNGTYMYRCYRKHWSFTVLGLRDISWKLENVKFRRAQISIYILTQVNINPAYQPEELRYCLHKVGIKAMVCSESFKTQDYYKMLTDIVPEIKEAKDKMVDSKETPFLKTIVMISDNEFAWVLWKHKLRNRLSHEFRLTAGRSLFGIDSFTAIDCFITT